MTILEEKSLYICNMSVGVQRCSLCLHSSAIRPANVTSLRSVILLIIAGKAPSVLTCLSFPEEGLSDRLQLGQL